MFFVPWGSQRGSITLANGAYMRLFEFGDLSPRFIFPVSYALRVVEEQCNRVSSGSWVPRTYRFFYAKPVFAVDGEPFPRAPVQEMNIDQQLACADSQEFNANDFSRS